MTETTQADPYKRDFDQFGTWGQAPEAEKKFREHLQKVEEIAEPDYLAELLTQLARARGLQRGFDDAHEILDRVEKMLRPKDKVARVRYLLERGRALRSSKKPAEARPLFLEAWKLGREIGAEFHAVDAGHMVALVVEPDEALAWNEKTAEYAMQSKHKRVRTWCGALYNNIGWTYHNGKKDYEKALGFFERALVVRKEMGAQNEISIARWCVARCMRSLNRTKEALAIHTDLWESDRKDSDNPSSGYTAEEIGECMLELGQAEESKAYFAEAYKRLSQDKWFADNEADRLARLKKLGGE
ncbi:MAG: hypothetical protein V3T86_11670 [Planctomycetota bacterium]